MKAMKKIIASLLAVATIVAGLNVGTVKVDAASKTKTITTTQECSIWTRPNTTEKYRQKKIPAGHQVTVYTDVIKSEKNDGKTFYKTKKGAYILCRCCDGNETTTTTTAPKAASFSDPAWARVIKEMQKCDHITASMRQVGNVWTNTYDGKSDNVWGMTQVWLNSLGLTEIVGNANFFAEWESEEYFSYKSVNNGYYIDLYLGDKGAGITIYDQDPTDSSIDKNGYFLEFYNEAWF